MADDMKGVLFLPVGFVCASDLFNRAIHSTRQEGLNAMIACKSTIQMRCVPRWQNLLQELCCIVVREVFVHFQAFQSFLFSLLVWGLHGMAAGVAEYFGRVLHGRW